RQLLDAPASTGSTMMENSDALGEETRAGIAQPGRATRVEGLAHELRRYLAVARSPGRVAVMMVGRTEARRSHAVDQVATLLEQGDPTCPTSSFQSCQVG